MRDLAVIIETGEIQCPMKWSTIGLEACIRYQDTRRGVRCHEYRCPMLDHRADLEDEVTKMHAAPTKAPSRVRKRGRPKKADTKRKEPVRRAWIPSSTKSAESSSE